MAPDPSNTGKPVRVRPERATLFVPVIWFIGAAPLAASKPWLAWLVLPPLLAGLWLWRAAVIADSAGIAVCNGLRWHRLRWDQVRGFDVRNRSVSPIVLTTTKGNRLHLTTMRRADLPRVLDVGAPAQG